MDGWGQLLFVALLFIVPYLFGLGRAKARPPMELEKRPGPPRGPARTPAEAKRRLEGTLLERILREVEGDLSQVPAEPMAARTARARASRAAADQGEEGVSLETGSERGPRVRVDRDEGAEAVARRRVEEAAQRNAALSDQDHAEFEARIKREEPAAGGAAAGRVVLTQAQLRHAIVWREVLGPPVGLRDGPEW